jgi:hypothetical protein
MEIRSLLLALGLALGLALRLALGLALGWLLLSLALLLGKIKRRLEATSTEQQRDQNARAVITHGNQASKRKYGTLKGNTEQI